MNRFRLLRHGSAVAGAISPPSPPPPPPSTTASITVGTAANRQLASDVLPQLLTFPAGNTIAVAKTTPGAGLVQMTRGKRFDLNPVLMGAPAAAYDGTPGSGWGGTRPTQPTITTEAPSLRFASFAHNAFTGTHDVMVVSDGPDAISSVDLQAEGTTVNATTMSWIYEWDTKDANGNYTAGTRRKTYGFAVRLTAANYIGIGAVTDATRGVEVVVTAHPVDGTLQDRVIGIGASRMTRYVVYPASVLYGAKIEIDTTLSGPVYPAFTTPGIDVEARFATWDDAINYATGRLTSTRTCSAPGRHVNIHIANNPSGFLECIDVDGRSPTASFQPWGHYQVTAAVPTVFRKTGITGPALWLPGAYGIEFIGTNIQFDFTHLGSAAGAVFTTTGQPAGTLERFWWRANHIGEDVCDWNMFDHLDDSRNPRNNTGMWAEACNCDHLRWQLAQPAGFISPDLIGARRRNCTRRDMSANDVDNGTEMSSGERIINVSSIPWRTPYKSITLQYIGGTGPAFVSRPFNTGTVRFFAPDGTTQIGTDLSLGNGTAGDFQHLCDLINNVGGIGQAAIAANFHAVCSVTTFGDRVRDRDMAYFDYGGVGVVDGVPGTFTGQNNTFSLAPVQSTGPTQFYSFMDVHQDDYQTVGGGGNWKNIVRVDRQCWDYVGVQFPFYDDGAYSFIDRNVFVNNDTQQAGAGVVGQVGAYIHSRMLNVSNPRNLLQMNTGGSGSGFSDGRSKIESLVYDRFAWNTTAIANPALTDCFFVTSNTNPSPGVNTNTLVGNGDYTTIYPGLAHHDPRPAGALLTNLISPHWPFDAFGIEAGATVPRGAKYLEPDLSSITGAQAAELAVVSLCGPGQSTDAASYTISGHTGAGDTGSLLVLQLNVSAIDN